MKDSRENFIKKFLCVQTNTKSFNKEKKLYFLFLHEDFYPVLFQNGADAPFGKSSYALRKRNIKKYHRESFLTIKHIIFLFRSNKFSDKKGAAFFSSTLLSRTSYPGPKGQRAKGPVGAKSSSHKKNENDLQLKKKSIFYLIVESIAFLILCSQQKKSTFEKYFLRTKNISISIHKPLASIEKQWKYSSFGFQGCFSRFFHPEVLIRILRKKIQDISLLHLIRRFLHSDLSFLDNTFKELPSTRIKNIFWNIYILEIDHFFVTDCNYYCTYDKWSYASSNHSLSFLQKMKEWTFFLHKKKYKNLKDSTYIPYDFLSSSTIHNSEEQWKKRRQISFLAQSNTYKYLRTNNNWFLFAPQAHSREEKEKEKAWNCLIQRRILYFFIRRLGYIFQKNTINSIFLFSKYHRSYDPSYFFLAYILQFTNKKNFVKINTKLFFLINYFVKRVVFFINPFHLIILILSKQNFCSSFGYPKSKSGWVTWTDSDIIEHFNRIQNSLFLFYSGCNNNKALSRIQYILHFSCAKTLACKHKTNLRQISKKFLWDAAPRLWVPNGRGNNLRNNILPHPPTVPRRGGPRGQKEQSPFFVPNQSKNSRLRSLYRNQKMTRVWNFHLTQMDSIILHFEDFSRLIKI